MNTKLLQEAKERGHLDLLSRRLQALGYFIRLEDRKLYVCLPNKNVNLDEFIPILKLAYGKWQNFRIHAEVEGGGTGNETGWEYVSIIYEEVK
jgi:hypothetical protein